MKRRPDSTPTFWSSEPVGQLPKGQGAFAFAEAEARVLDAMTDGARRCLYCDARRTDVRSEDGSPPLCKACRAGWAERHPWTPTVPQ